MLQWDSDFFGARVARVTSNRLTAESLAELRRWCGAERVEWLYFLADSDDRDTVVLAESAGFRFVDVRIELDLALASARRREPALRDGVRIRTATADDVAALRPIAAEVHTDSRYFFDPGVPRERARALYETWIERSISSDFADVVLVAELDGGAAGYITGRLDADASASIGLIGVGEQARGHGLGTALLDAWMVWATSHGAQRATVVTQGRNVVAQRLYQGVGFRTRAVFLWYHFWPAVRRDIAP
jgi:ribosomal protein S18 acetylase RimI-like enzyme